MNKEHSRNTAIHRRLIAACVKLAKPLLRTAWPIIQIVRCLRGRLWIISGVEISTGETLTIGFIGSDSSRNYWTNLIFNGVCEEKLTGNKWLWDSLRIARAGTCGVSLMVAEIPSVFIKVFQRPKEIYIPCWIYGEVDISRIPILSKHKHHETLASDVRKINKNRLLFEVTNQPQKFNEFYYDMYLPFITKRHSKNAIFEDYEALYNLFKKGDLLLIKRGDKHIAGMLITYTAKKAWLWILGTMHGDLEYVKAGAIGALYYYSFKYLKEKGFVKVGMGGSRAFLRDGALQYKKKWGLEIIGTSSIGFLIKPTMTTPAVNGFLMNNPFIFKDRARLNDAVFISADQALDDKAFERIYHYYYFQGLAKILLYRLFETNELSPVSIPKSFSAIIDVIPTRCKL